MTFFSEKLLCSLNSIKRSRSFAKTGDVRPNWDDLSYSLQIKFMNEFLDMLHTTIYYEFLATICDIKPKLVEKLSLANKASSRIILIKYFYDFFEEHVDSTLEMINKKVIPFNSYCAI